MQLRIKSQHINLSDSQTALIENKAEKLQHLADRLADESTEFRVEVRHEQSRKNHHRAGEGRGRRNRAIALSRRLARKI